MRRPFLDLPPHLLSRCSPGTPSSPMDVMHCRNLASQPVQAPGPGPHFPCIDGTQSTPGQPPPVFSPAHQLQTWLNSGSHMNTHLPGQCREPRRSPTRLLCPVWLLGNREQSWVRISRDGVSVPHTFVSSPAAAERASGGGAGVRHSAFLPAAQRAAWEVQGGCPVSQPEPIPSAPSEPASPPVFLPLSFPPALRKVTQSSCRWPCPSCSLSPLLPVEQALHSSILPRYVLEPLVAL